MDIFTLVGRIVLDGADKAQQQLKGIEGFAKNNEKAFRAVGMALTGFGVAVTGTLALAIKSAAEEEAGIIKLTQALKNVGVNYDAVKDSLEGVIDATQQKTSVADDKQREALAQLVAITGDYNQALKLLPLTLDLAAGKGMDLASASQVIGRVAEGNTTILTRYGITLKEGATATEALGELQAKYGGQAEAYGQSMAGQFDLLKNNISDVMESIGGTVLPILTDLFKNHISPLILKIKEWTDAHPELTKQIVILAGVAGGLATVLGPILIMLPSLITSLGLIKVAMIGLNAAMGPTGWIIAGISAALAIAVPFFISATNKTKDLTGAMSDLEDKANSVRRVLAQPEWAMIGERASISQEEFKRLANELGMTTKELYNLLVAAGMVQRTMGGKEGTIYLQNLQEIKKAVEGVTDSSEKLNQTMQGTKRSIASATWAAEGYTYHMELFTQAEIDAAKASGKKVDVLKTQADVTVDNTDKAKIYKISLDDAAKSTTLLTDATNVLMTAQTNLQEIMARNAAITAAGGKLTLEQILEYGRAAIEERRAGGTTGLPYYEQPGYQQPSERGEGYTGPLPASQYGALITEPSFLTRIGSLMPYRTMAEKGPEYISPVGQKVNIFVELDGRTIAKAIGQPLVDEIRLRTGVKI